MKTISIAVDGPAGAGKSTIAKKVSKELGFLHADTGAMYRAVALYVRSNGGDTKNCDSVISLLNEIKIDMMEKDGELTVLLNGDDVSSQIRTPEVSVGASDVAVIPDVRLKLVEIQRMIAKKQNVLMDGRDIGTYVLPGADVKIFLTAAENVRAERRLKELLEKGQKATFEEVYQDIKYRDKNDSERDFAPLCKAEDSVLVDTSELSIGGAVATVLDVISKRICIRPLEN